MKNKKLLCLSLLLGGLFFWTSRVQAVTPANFLGRIFLQVEAHGEAWYINPLDGHRYFLGRPTDAFAAMRAFGLGVSNQTFASWRSYAPARLSGRIVLKTEDLGKAYYINPKNLQLLYLGGPSDAFAVMRQTGIGISNATLSLIPVEFNLPIVVGGSATPVINNQPTSSAYLSWTYKKKVYSLNLNLDTKLYQSYATSPKDYVYKGTLPVNWREGYYQRFLISKSGDNSIDALTNEFKILAQNNNLSADELVELVVAFVQSIPYDYARVNSSLRPNYPYETLYKKLGVCSDKTFLAMMILKNLGYGVADLDYPDRNHAGLGLACSSQYAIYDATYCFVETTNFFPIGFVPQSLSTAGIAIKPENKTIVGQFDHVFDITALGRVEIYQKTSGKIYGGIVATHQLVDKLKLLETSLVANQPIINSLKQQVDEKLSQVNVAKQQLQEFLAQGKNEAYNQLVPRYNQLIQEYNQLVNNYKLKIDIYNSQSDAYNQGVNDLYVAGK